MQEPGPVHRIVQGRPPNAAYAADGEAQHEAKKAGQAAASGNLAAAAAHLASAQHFASIAGTSAANTATLQAYASVLAAVNSIQAAHRSDNTTPAHDGSDDLMSKDFDPGLCEATWGGGATICLAPGPKRRTQERDGIPLIPPFQLPLPLWPDDECDCVYRALNVDEVPDFILGRGIHRPEPWAGTTPEQHLTLTQHKFDPWISTTRSQRIAETRYAEGDKYGGHIVKIDLKVVGLESEVLDVSNSVLAARLRHGLASTTTTRVMAG